MGINGSIVTATEAPISYSSHAIFNLRVSEFLLALLFLGAAAIAQSMPRAEPPNSTWTSTSSPTISFNIHPTYIFDPPPLHGTPLACPDDEKRCGHHVCYDEKAQWCCPGKMNVCQVAELCAEGKVGEDQVVYGCAPPDSIGGHDPRIRTTAFESDGRGEVTKTMTGTLMTRIPAAGSSNILQISTTTATARLSRPTTNAGRRLGAPSILQSLSFFFAHNARAVTFPAPIKSESCSDICCALGEVCARSSTGPKCWLQAKQPQTTNDGEAATVDGTLGSTGRKGIAVVASAAGATASRAHHHKKGSAARPVVPTLLYTLLPSISFAAASFPLNSAIASANGLFASTPQVNPLPRAYLDESSVISRRWSCHIPNQECGSKGCWNPAKHFCCQQPEGDYGLCAANRGETCCGSMCCPQHTECVVTGNYLCTPRPSSAQKGQADATMSTTLHEEVINDKGLGRGSGSEESSAAENLKAVWIVVMVAGIAPLVHWLL